MVDLGYGDAGKGGVVDWLSGDSGRRGVADWVSGDSGRRGVADWVAGDSGKDGVADWVSSDRPVHAVVRFNGGAQAAHNVVTDDGRHHTFAQFGSGSFTPGVRTHLSRFMLVDPLALAAEAAHLAAVGVRDALDLLTVDRDALLTTPYHRAANRARERPGDGTGTAPVAWGSARPRATRSTTPTTRRAWRTAPLRGRSHASWPGSATG